MRELSNKRLVEICLSFMLGISVPSLIEAISKKVEGFILWFFVVIVLVSMIGATIYYFLIDESKNKFFFMYEIGLIIYLTCWVYGIARIISSDFANKGFYGFIITIMLFLGYGLWGLLYHRYEKNESWKESFTKSLRVKFAALSILFMILIPIIQYSNLLK